MQKIDRLGWAAGMAFTAYGRRVGIRVNDAAALERLPRHLPCGWKPAPPRPDGAPVVEHLYSLLVAKNAPGSVVKRFHLLYAGAGRVARTTDADEVFDALESSLRLYTAEWARRRVFVHAGVVGWQGMAIVIPGRSFSGKSTLVRELVRAGAVYYSDEYAVFDGRGRVHPYTKPLSIREAGDAGRQTHYAVETLGGRAGKTPLPVGVILSAQYKAGARWRPQELSRGQGALELLANTVAVRRQPETTLATLRQAVSGASAWKGARGEAADLVQSIMKFAAPGYGRLAMAG